MEKEGERKRGRMRECGTEDTDRERKIRMGKIIMKEREGERWKKGKTRQREKDLRERKGNRPGQLWRDDERET